MFEIREYEFEFKGMTPLLMHSDDFKWAEKCKVWISKPENKKRCTAGDDRTPGFMWLGHCYKGIPPGFDKGIIAVPAAVVSAAIRDAGKMTQIPGQGKKTYKAQTQSGMRFVGSHIALFNGKIEQVIPWNSLAEALAEEFDFEKHMEIVEAKGFSLNVQRVRVGQKRHIRVRPEFDKWVLKGRLIVQDDSLTDDVVLMLLQNAGVYKGLGDWRPGAPTPGPYGTYEVTKLEQL